MISLDKSKAYLYKISELSHLNSLKSKYGVDYSLLYGQAKKRVWYDGEINTNTIRNNIFKRIFFNSKLHCAYCNKLLIREKREIDHFIPNSDHPQLSFHPYNLIPSCSYCNGTLKSTFNPEVIYTKKYSDSIFFIFHPYLDKVDEHFILNHDGISFDYERCSIQALNSIELFELYTEEAHIQRRNDLTIRNMKSKLSNEELITLIEKIASYK